MLKVNVHEIWSTTVNVVLECYVCFFNSQRFKHNTEHAKKNSFVTIIYSCEKSSAVKSINRV